MKRGHCMITKRRLTECRNPEHGAEFYETLVTRQRGNG